MDVEPYLSFATNVTRQLHRRWHASGASFDDMRSGAYIGLLKAAHAYEQDAPALAFEAFAYWPIYDEIKAITRQEWRSRGVIDTTVGGRGGETHVKVQRLPIVPWPTLPGDDRDELFDPRDQRDPLDALERWSERDALLRMTLTRRERITLCGIFGGLTDVAIAQRAGVRPQAINVARARIIRKARRCLMVAA